MADFDSTSCVQRRNLDDFPANITLLQNFSSKLISYFRIFGQKVYPGKWHIPEYPNIASPSVPPPPPDHKTCLCTKFRVICTNENRVRGKRNRRIFYYVILENGLVSVQLAHQHGCRIINVFRLPKL